MNKKLFIRTESILLVIAMVFNPTGYLGDLKAETANNSNGRKTGRAQLKKYLAALATMKDWKYKIRMKGTNFNPNNISIINPYNTKQVFHYYTYYSSDPGMIYYQIEPNPRFLTRPVTVKQTSEAKSWIRQGLKAGAAVSGAYVLYKAFRLLPSLAFPPSLIPNLVLP